MPLHRKKTLHRKGSEFVKGKDAHSTLSDCEYPNSSAERSSCQRAPYWLRIRYMEKRTLLNKLERFGAKSTPLPLDELKKSLNTLETSIGLIPESYRAYLLHFGASILFNINIVFKVLQPSPWSDEQGNDTLESLYGLAESGKEYTVF